MRLQIISVAAALMVLSTPASSPQAASASGAATVVDSAGKVVGPFVYAFGGNVLVTVAGENLAISVTTAGFQDLGAGNVRFYHTSADCSGPRYMYAGDLPYFGYIASTKLYYPSLPIQNMTMQSEEVYSNFSDNLAKPGECNKEDSPLKSSYYGAAASRAISVLGNFMPPFKVIK